MAEMLASLTCQADLEEEILRLQESLKEGNEKLEILEWDLNQCKGEKADVERKYLQLYDQQFSKEQRRPTQVTMPHSFADFNPHEELEALRKEVSNYKSQVRIWQDLGSIYQAAATDFEEQLSDLRDEAAVVRNIKARHTSLEQEHAFTLEKIRSLEVQLDEDISLREKLRKSTAKIEDKSYKLQDLTAAKILLELEVSSLHKRLNECYIQNSDMARTIQRLEVERNSLRETLARRSTPSVSDEEMSCPSLADELSNYKEAYHQVQKELMTHEALFKDLEADYAKEVETHKIKTDLLKADSAAVRQAFEGLQVELEAQRQLYEELSDTYDDEAERYRSAHKNLREDLATSRSWHAANQELKAQEELHAVELDNYRKRIEKLKIERGTQDTTAAEKLHEIDMLTRNVTQLRDEKDTHRRTIALLKKDLHKSDETLKKYREGTQIKLNEFKSKVERAKKHTKKEVAQLSTHVDCFQVASKPR
eukprot:TRINITY_DN8049_c0_g2_i1.p1 TRINITY_DN8049_c0_g2~~TRINITY_DN8049_c0_g2_i1.p1  ORF type:complete len:480 (+),score=99.56 TRINITY_DN8049_c0_g2_i1:669-2108(+)